jgi:hypothetical protein
MVESRSRATRARAELALVRLLHELRDDDVFLVVLGGLVPEVLTRDDGLIPAHLGTTDVDVLLITHIDADANLGVVERALERAEFNPDPSETGWRWQGRVNDWPVKLEFLCDLPDHREREIVRPRGCATLAAVNLRGTGYVATDSPRRNCPATWPTAHLWRCASGSPGLEGYLLSKCVAVRTRGATKDYYDFVYVLLHNRAGGPEQAAQRLLDGELSHALVPLRTTFLEVRERYMKTTDIGPASYAEQALEVEPEADGALLRADAVDVVQRFFAALGR